MVPSRFGFVVEAVSEVVVAVTKSNTVGQKKNNVNTPGFVVEVVAGITDLVLSAIDEILCIFTYKK